MKRQPTYIVGKPRMVIIGLLGVLAGVLVAAKWNPFPLTPRERLVPAAYRVPKIPGGTALRLAMVHDVLHERYLRHGSAWYTQRNKDAQAIIDHLAPAAGAAPSGKYLDAMDDLAIGLQSLGNFDEAAKVMRKKLAMLPAVPEPATQPSGNADSASTDEVELQDLQRILAAQDLPLEQHHAYTACANLGTILVHGAMAKALLGAAAAKAQVREGLDLLRKAIVINPGAHFGREKWQAIAVEHLLAAMEHPELLQEYDLIGQRIGDSFPLTELGPSFRARRRGFPPTDADISPSLRVDIRDEVWRTGMDKKWVQIVHPEYSQPMPFDEPVLAIIGMWTLGGGANPHFALALATTMESIGQYNIAWNAYERAVELQDHFWPDKAVREKMVEQCRTEQAVLAERESPGNPDAWQEKMRDTHRRELAWGLAYQKAYQDYESARITAGVSLDQPDFYQAFFQSHPPIASPPGLADDFILTQIEADNPLDLLPCMVLGFAIAMLVASWTGRRLQAV